MSVSGGISQPEAEGWLCSRSGMWTGARGAWMVANDLHQARQRASFVSSIIRTEYLERLRTHTQPLPLPLR